MRPNEATGMQWRICETDLKLHPPADPGALLPCDESVCKLPLRAAAAAGDLGRWLLSG